MKKRSKNKKPLRASYRSFWQFWRDAFPKDFMKRAKERQYKHLTSRQRSKKKGEEIASELLRDLTKNL
jgi:hypothetical protein